MALIPGVEINAIVREDIGLWEGELHILGLGMDTDDEAFEAALAAQRGRRAERFARTLRRLADLGMPVDAQLETLVSGPDDALGRPIVARALVATGWATTVEDAFRRLIGKGTPGYVAREGLGPSEAIRAIRAAGGLPALAHFSDAPDRTPLLRELMDEGLGGLEVYYRTFDRPTTEAMAVTAAALGLVPTGGTDYHGDTGTYAEAHAQLWVPPEVGAEVQGRLSREPSARG
jgi:predicted metal-dependent phosphoesterase TrpH